MKRICWYFDFVSPFSYLQSRLLGRLEEHAEITYRPVLLAGLLDHWGTIGPAEIAPKRLHTYRFCRWWADRHGIPFVLPPAHPFNPLGALRLAVARDGDPATVHAIFEFIWAHGRDPNEPDRWRELAASLGVEDPASLTSRSSVKWKLRENTQEAASHGVFGVPSMEIDGEVFWGVDATDMALDFLADPGLLETPEMARYESLPVGARRQGGSTA